MVMGWIDIVVIGGIWITRVVMVMAMELIIKLMMDMGPAICRLVQVIVVKRKTMVLEQSKCLVMVMV